MNIRGDSENIAADEWREKEDVPSREGKCGLPVSAS